LRQETTLWTGNSQSKNDNALAENRTIPFFTQKMKRIKSISHRFCPEYSS